MLLGNANQSTVNGPFLEANIMSVKGKVVQPDDKESFIYKG
jgi:hypothetical protein